MAEKIKSFWEKKSTDILIGIIIILFIGGLKLYDSKEDLRYVNENVKHQELIKILNELRASDQKQNEALSEINFQMRARWGYDIFEKKENDQWKKMWQEAQKERGSRGGGKPSKINEDLYNKIEFVPDEDNQLATERGR
jgi:hypothetical protein